MAESQTGTPTRTRTAEQEPTQTVVLEREVQEKRTSGKNIKGALTLEKLPGLGKGLGYQLNNKSAPVLQLRLQPPSNEHKVKWSTDVVDNEFMGKKKSKCCCIYEKPKVFGESSSSSDEESDDDGDCTPHCRGHKKKCYRHGKSHDHDHEDHQDHGHDGPAKDEAGPSGVDANSSTQKG